MHVCLPSDVHTYVIQSEALSGGLLKKLLKDLEEKPVGSGQQIEPVWELASRLGLLTQTGPETEIDRDPWECVRNV